MVFFNYSTKLMAAKIVYYGPGLCGKTTNLQYIYNKTSPKARGEMVSLATETDRTLFFDLLPLDVGTIAGFKARFQLYTVPGQVFYNSTRRLVLKGVDAIVFVADSQKPMMDANIESFNNMLDNLRSHNLKLENIPYVIQYNKRDLLNIFNIEELSRYLNKDNVPYFEAVAITGKGVIDTLKGISKLTIRHLRKKAQEQVSTPAIKPTFTIEKKAEEPLTISKPSPPTIASAASDTAHPAEAAREERKLSLKEKLDLLKQKRETAIKEKEQEIEIEEEERIKENESLAENSDSHSQEEQSYQHNQSNSSESEPTEEIRYSQIEDISSSKQEEKAENSSTEEYQEQSLDDLEDMLLNSDRREQEEEKAERSSEEQSSDVDALLSSVYSSVFDPVDSEISKDTDKLLHDYLLSNVPDLIQEITVEKQYTLNIDPEIYKSLQDAVIEIKFNSLDRESSKQIFNLQISKPDKTIPKKLILNLKFTVKGD